MDIIRYIKELLYQYERVTIPNFGTFVTDYLPAFINKSKKYIAPPNKKVTFKPGMKSDDKILSNYICKKEGIDTQEVGKQIKTFVAKLEAVLQTEGKVVLKGIGQLMKDKDKVFLKQDFRSNLLFDSFGMREVKLDMPAKEATEETTKEKEKEKKKNHRVYNQHRTIRKVLLYTPIAAVLVFVFVYLYLTVIYNGNGQPQSNNQGIYPTSPENGQINEVIDQITDKREALLYTEPPKPGFYIIAGSFKDVVNANAFKSELAEKGYSSMIISSDNKLYRVALRKLDTREEAQKELDNFRKSLNSSLWILSQ